MSHPLEALGAEIMRSLGKTLSQIALYSTRHPAVGATLTEIAAVLNRGFDEGQCQEIVLSLDGERLLINGRHLGGIKEQPPAIQTVFNKFNLHSLTFRRGVDKDELISFCDIFLVKVVDAKFKLADWLAEKHIAHIRANEAIYAKVDKEEDLARGGARPAGTGEGGAGSGGGEFGGTGGGGQGSGGAAGTLGDGAPAGGLPPTEASAPAQEPIPAHMEPLRKILLRLIRGSGGNEASGAQSLDAAFAECRDELEKLSLLSSKALMDETIRAQNEMRRMAAVLRRAFEGRIVVDADGKILGVDPVAERLLGRDAKKLAGEKLDARVEPGTQMLSLARELGLMPIQPFSPAASTKGTKEVVDTLLASGAIVLNEQERMVGLVASLSDAAKIKEYERLKDEMTSSVLRAFKAPLDNLDKALDQIKTVFPDELPAAQRSLLNHIESQVKWARHSLRSLEDYAAVGQGRLKVFQLGCHVSDIVSDAVEAVGALARAKGVVIESKVGKNLPQVTADPRRCAGVLRELLTNAIKNSDAKEKIEVIAKTKDDELQSFVVVSVKDEGRGVQQDEFQRLFAEFTHVRGRNDEQSLGLGLTIAEKIIALQNGKLWASQEGERGLTVSFTLPTFVPPPDYKAPETAKPAEVKQTWWKKLLGRKPSA
jgi:signal transduction histidine kinase